MANSRKLIVEVVGDDRQLQRTLDRTETRLQKFSRNVSGAARGAGIGGGIFAVGGKGGLVAGAAALGLAVRSVVNASREAQVILGQTSVAVEGAGLSWQRNAARIDQAATRISQASAFDDEAVLQSFQVFVRGQKDVEKSLDLTALAADVARGRYTDLESATQLVNKAAMGQVGALRRAGIAIDKTATKQEALNLLEARFAGAAETYADSSVGASEKLQVAWENLAEKAGGPLALVLGDVATGLTGVIGLMERIPKIDVSGLDLIRKALGRDGGAGTTGAPAGLRGPGPAFTPAGPTGVLRPGKDVGKKLADGVSNALQSAELDARISGSTRRLRAVLERESAALKEALTTFGLKPKEKLALKQSLLGVTDELRSIDEAAADAIRRRGDALKQAAEQRARDAKAAADKLVQQADRIKQATLRLFDRGQTDVLNKRALADSQAALRAAQRLGGPVGIRLAQRDVADARAAVTRARLEAAPARVKGGAFTLGTITIHVHGSDKPEEVARKVVEIIKRGGRHSSVQSRGPAAGAYNGPH